MTRVTNKFMSLALAFLAFLMISCDKLDLPTPTKTKMQGTWQLTSAVDADGNDAPSAVAAGLQSPERLTGPAYLFVNRESPGASQGKLTWTVLIGVGLVIIAATAITLRRTRAVRQ